MPSFRYAAAAALSAAGLLATGTATAVPQSFVVGNLADPNCQFATIDQALSAAQANGPELDYIRVANSASYSSQALSVGNQSVLIEGGYADCQLNVDTARPVTTISGTSSGPVLRVEPFTAGNYEVRLQRLQITGGGNNSSDGGGIALQPGSGTVAKLVLDHTEVSNNRASRGGGIYAARGAQSNGQFVLLLRAGTRIVDNSASDAGGGIYLANGQLQAEADDLHIARNSAGGAGGGVALLNGTALIGNPEERAPRNDVTGAVVEQNTAFSMGGGIYLSGSTTQMVAHELIVDRNTAGGGGGIAVDNSARLFLIRDYSNDLGWYCPSSAECNRLSNNQSADGVSYGSHGGALALYNNAQATLAQAVVRNNKAQEGAAAFVDRAELGAESVLFTGNQSTDLPDQESAIVRITHFVPGPPAKLLIAFSTFVANTRSIAGALQPATDITARHPPTFSVYSSVFLDSPNPWTVYGTHRSDCVVRRGGGALDSNGFHTRSIVTNDAESRLFLAPQAANWRPRFDSPLTDVCDANNYFPTYRDRDLQRHCSRDEAKPDGFGICDIGAWENDQLFADGYNN